VATKLTGFPPESAESKITTGIPARVAPSTDPTSALSLSGASAMPATFCAVNDCTRSIWFLRSSSRSGPFQTMSTSSSRDAFTAPACTLFQNSCVVPFRITAMRIRFFSGSGEPSSAFFVQPSANDETSRSPNNARRTGFSLTSLVGRGQSSLRRLLLIGGEQRRLRTECRV
jgi:hypothetical protein